MLYNSIKLDLSYLTVDNVIVEINIYGEKMKFSKLCFGKTKLMALFLLVTSLPVQAADRKSVV